MTTTKVPGRVLAWAALLVALGASVLANVAYARPELGPRLSAATAPVLTVLAAGLIERVPLATARVWQRWLAWLGLGAVAAAAFITSYEHQFALLLAYGNPWLSAVLLPVAVDGLIVLASVCLAVVAERRRVLAAQVRRSPDGLEYSRTASAAAPQVPAEVPPAPTRPAPRRPAAKTRTRRRPDVTRVMAEQLLAATPAPTRKDVAAQLGISVRRLRDVLAAPGPVKRVNGSPEAIRTTERVDGGVGRG